MKIDINFTKEKQFFNKIINDLIFKKKLFITKFNKFLIDKVFISLFSEYTSEQKNIEIQNILLEQKRKELRENERIKYLFRYKIGTEESLGDFKPIGENMKKTRIGHIMYKVETNDYNKGYIDSNALTEQGIERLIKTKNISLKTNNLIIKKPLVDDGYIIKFNQSNQPNFIHLMNKRLKH